jgi:Spy/CpxP family protein refolding chaperone
MLASYRRDSSITEIAMKLRVALIAGALLASAVALAGPHGGHGPDMNRMAILLDLNDTQKAEVQKILDEQHDKLDAVHAQQRAAGTKPTREERVKFHQELKQDTLAKLQGVLTPEQIKKFEVLTERPHRHRGHGDGQDKTN